MKRTHRSVLAMGSMLVMLIGLGAGLNVEGVVSSSEGLTSTASGPGQAEASVSPPPDTAASPTLDATPTAEPPPTPTPSPDYPPIEVKVAALVEFCKPDATGCISDVDDSLRGIVAPSCRLSDDRSPHGHGVRTV